MKKSFLTTSLYLVALLCLTACSEDSGTGSSESSVEAQIQRLETSTTSVGPGEIISSVTNQNIFFVVNKISIESVKTASGEIEAGPSKPFKVTAEIGSFLNSDSLENEGVNLNVKVMKESASELQGNYFNGSFFPAAGTSVALGATGSVHVYCRLADIELGQYRMNCSDNYSNNGYTISEESLQSSSNKEGFYLNVGLSYDDDASDSRIGIESRYLASFPFVVTD